MQQQSSNISIHTQQSFDSCIEQVSQSKQQSIKSITITIDQQLLLYELNRVQDQMIYYKQQYIKIKRINQAILQAIQKIVGLQLADDINTIIQGWSQNCRDKNKKEFECAQEYALELNQALYKILQIHYNGLIKQSSISEYSNISPKLTPTKTIKDKTALKQVYPKTDCISNQNIKEASTKTNNQKISINKSKKQNAVNKGVSTNREKVSPKFNIFNKENTANKLNTSNRAKTPKNRESMGKCIKLQQIQQGVYTDQVKEQSNTSTKCTVTPKNMITPRNKQKQYNLISSHMIQQNGIQNSIATQLLCEKCQIAYRPNEFMNHLNRCRSEVEDLSRITLETQQEQAHRRLNYTTMMNNLNNIRDQIQGQMELLKYTKEKINRNALRKKLEKQLEQVEQLIKSKHQEEMFKGAFMKFK